MPHASSETGLRFFSFLPFLTFYRLFCPVTIMVFLAKKLHFFDFVAFYRVFLLPQSGRASSHTVLRGNKNVARTTGPD